MRAAALAGGAVSVFIVGAGVLIAELAISLPLSTERNYQGTDFKIPKRTTSAAADASRTAQVSRERRRNSDGLAMWEYSLGAGFTREFQQETERLATTTGGEPVHDASGGRPGSVHKPATSIAPGIDKEPTFIGIQHIQQAVFQAPGQSRHPQSLRPFSATKTGGAEGAGVVEGRRPGPNNR